VTLSQRHASPLPPPLRGPTSPRPDAKRLAAGRPQICARYGVPGLPSVSGIGVGKEKLMRQALMMELKSAGEHLPELRQIARRVIDCALNTLT
jgi:hypothetical protein